MHTDETPCVLCNRLKRNTDRRVKTDMESQASVFVQHALNKLQESGFNGLPTIGDLNNATLEAPHIWDVPDLERPVSQPEPSHDEQRFMALTNCLFTQSVFPCRLALPCKQNRESNPHLLQVAVIESGLVLLSPKRTLTNCATKAVSHNRCSPAGSLSLVNCAGGLDREA